MALRTVQLRHERRVRLIFTKRLSFAAFQSAAFYAVENRDSRATSPPVVRAFRVPHSPDVVELQLGEDLVPGCLYRFFAKGVPDVDGDVTANAFVDVLVDKPGSGALSGARRRATNLEVLLYGLDVAWSSNDFVETPAGDLELTGSAESVLTHLGHCLQSNGLPWAPEYGAHPREHLGGSSAGIATLRGAVLVAARRDDRIASFDCTVDASESGEVVLTCDVALRGQPAGIKERRTIRIR